MKRKFDVKSLKVQLWAYFILFSVLILAVLWSLQILFIRSYYQIMKTAEVKKAVSSIVAMYGDNDFESELQQIAFKSNLTVQLTDKDGNIIISKDMTGNEEPGRPPMNMFDSARQQLLSSGENTLSINMNNSMFHTAMMVEAVKLTSSSGETQLLFVSSNLEPIDSTVKILQSQLIYITIILLVLAFGISFLISRKIAKPITKLTDSAEKLAQGDYSVHFDEGSYSEINQLSNTLNFATTQISKVDELRKDLIANVSHDLRTPLTMIKAYAEMIRDLSGQNPVKREQHLNVIIGETDRLSTLVNDILDLSKIQSGTDELKIASFNISETLQIILQRYYILTEKEGYVFHVKCPDDIFAKGDEHKIEQVIYNLVNNAINYTGEDKNVFITLYDLPEHARFEVRDTGTGIEAAELENIWERYYKVDKTHKRAVVGTGLGLSIVKNILELHHAKYGVVSRKGEGSIFWFELDKS